jgi:hypothetical protein
MFDKNIARLCVCFATLALTFLGAQAQQVNLSTTIGANSNLGYKQGALGLRGEIFQKLNDKFTADFSGAIRHAQKNDGGGFNMSASADVRYLL